MRLGLVEPALLLDPALKPTRALSERSVGNAAYEQRRAAQHQQRSKGAAAQETNGRKPGPTENPCDTLADDARVDALAHADDVESRGCHAGAKAGAVPTDGGAGR